MKALEIRCSILVPRATVSFGRQRHFKTSSTGDENDMFPAAKLVFTELAHISPPRLILVSARQLSCALSGDTFLKDYVTKFITKPI